MTVNVSKPVVNVREKLAELDKPSGVAGEAMLRAETPQEQFNLIGAGRKNLAINGAMDIWQRGNTFSNLNSNDTYSADRMHSVAYNSNFAISSGGQIERSYIYGTQIDGTNFSHAMKISPSSTWKLAYLDQRVEDVTKFSDVHVTISYYARANKAAVIVPTPRVNQMFGSGGSATVSAYHQSPTTVELSTDWKRFSYTLYCPSITGKTVGSGHYANFYIFQGTDLSALGWIEITGLQIEYGKIATPFEHRSYGEELALCQRYFFKMDFPQTTTFGPAHHQTTNTLRAVVEAPQPMRTTPSINSSGQPTWFVYWNGGSNAGTFNQGDRFSVVGGSLDNNRITLQATITGVTGLVGGLFGYAGDFNFDAEL